MVVSRGHHFGPHAASTAAPGPGQGETPMGGWGAAVDAVGSAGHLNSSGGGGGSGAGSAAAAQATRLVASEVAGVLRAELGVALGEACAGVEHRIGAQLLLLDNRCGSNCPVVNRPLLPTFRLFHSFYFFSNAPPCGSIEYRLRALEQHAQAAQASQEQRMARSAEEGARITALVESRLGAHLEATAALLSAKAPPAAQPATTRSPVPAPSKQPQQHRPPAPQLLARPPPYAPELQGTQLLAPPPPQEQLLARPPAPQKGRYFSQENVTRN